MTWSFLHLPVAACIPSLVLWVVACAAPTVQRPNDNDKLTDPPDAGNVAPPGLQPVPTPYPYRRLPVRGQTQRDVVDVFVQANSAGDPIVAAVSAVDQSFCAELTLAEPADYDIAVTAQASDGRISAQSSHLSVTYDPAAPDLPGVTLCQGQAPSR
jgi:hypothetical protein